MTGERQTMCPSSPLLSLQKEKNIYIWKEKKEKEEAKGLFAIQETSNHKIIDRVLLKHIFGHVKGKSCL